MNTKFEEVLGKIDEIRKSLNIIENDTSDDLQTNIAVKKMLKDLSVIYSQAFYLYWK